MLKGDVISGVVWILLSGIELLLSMSPQLVIPRSPGRKGKNSA